MDAPRVLIERILNGYPATLESLFSNPGDEARPP